MVGRSIQRIFEWEHIRTGVLIASIMEATVVPIPLELLLIPTMIARREKLWGLATTALLGSFVGAAVWYVLGVWFFDGLGDELISWVGGAHQVEEYRRKLDAQGFWLVLAGGLTPTPFQIVCFVAGAVSYSVPLFIVACVISRGIRYYALAALVHWLGDVAEEWWRDHKVLVTAAGFGVLGVLYAVTRGLQYAMDA